MQDSPSERQEQQSGKPKRTDGELLAAEFAYQKQFTSKYMVRPMSRNCIPFKTEYERRKRYYDKLAEISNRYGINCENYFRFCVRDLKISDIRDAASTDILKRYSLYLNNEKYLRFVYEDFTKTAEKVAEVCVENNMTPSEYISLLISNNSLGYEYYSGNISKYYLAGISNFSEIYGKMDVQTKEELSSVEEASEAMSNTLRESFHRFGGDFCGPISYTESIIKAKQNTK